VKRETSHHTRRRASESKPLAVVAAKLFGQFVAIVNL